MTILLAHGALGIYDELLFLGVAVIFVVMMGISFVRSRNQPPRLPEEPETPDSPTQGEAPDHISLD